jgi:hypothetical protein
MGRSISRVLSGLTVFAGARIASACTLCAENLSNDVSGNTVSPLGRGFFWSIILMIALPFLSAATVAFKIARARRRPK